MIVHILPLILDYLDIPFELIKTCKSLRRNCRKYALTILNHLSINPNIIPIYKWKCIISHYEPHSQFCNLHCPFFNKLHTLECRNSLITDSGLKYMPNIKKLILRCQAGYRNYNITNAGLKHIPNIEYLELLGLNYSKYITDEGLQYIQNVKVLVLSSSKNITDNGLKYLPNIATLVLPSNRDITDEGLKYIPNIRVLILPANIEITDNGIKVLKNLCIYKRNANCYYDHNFQTHTESIWDKNMTEYLRRHKIYPETYHHYYYFVK